MRWQPGDYAEGVITVLQIVWFGLARPGAGVNVCAVGGLVEGDEKDGGGWFAGGKSFRGSLKEARKIGAVSETAPIWKRRKRS